MASNCGVAVVPEKLILIQRLYNKVLRNSVNSSWYFRQNNLYKDLEIETVNQTIETIAITKPLPKVMTIDFSITSIFLDNTHED